MSGNEIFALICTITGVVFLTLKFFDLIDLIEQPTKKSKSTRKTHAAKCGSFFMPQN